MGIYDTFDNFINEVQVKCYSDIGGTMSVFKEGDKVPEGKLDNDFETVAYYGPNYNIFDYTSTKKVVIVRYGVFLAVKSLEDLRDDDTCGYLCIDKYGYQIDIVDKADDYRLYQSNYDYEVTERKSLLNIFKKSLSEDLNSKDVERSKRKSIFDKLKNLMR